MTSPKPRPQVSIVISLLNEENTITELVRRVAATLDANSTSFEILLVDDGSTDKTIASIRDLESEDARVKAFELTRNFGQVNALACGIFAAEGDIVVTMDGDLQNPPEEIPKLIAAIKERGQIANGKRMIRYDNPARQFGSRIVHHLANYLTGAQIEDFGGNFRAYHRDVVEGMRQMWSAGKPLLPLALWAGYPVIEVAVEHAPPFQGRTRYSVPKLVQINLELVTAFTTTPMTLMGAAGVALLALGILMVILASSWLTAALGMTFSIVGSVFCAAGVLGLYIGRIYQLISGNGPAFLIRRGPRDEG